MNSTEPEISIVCTTYNHERYIRDALKGFISQNTTYSFEVIVHDDASTDGTAAVIMDYARKYPEIIKPIIQEENQHSKGISIFRSYILPLAKGKYIACCEGDDYWCDSQKLQLQADYLESHPECPACAHDTTIYDCRTGKQRTLSKMTSEGMLPINLLLTNGSSYHTSSLFTRREIYENMPDFAKPRAGIGDYPKRVYLALIGGVYFIDRVMSVYRFRTDGSWSSRSYANPDAAYAAHMAMTEMLAEANEWSTFKFDKFFSYAILEEEFAAFECKQKWREMLDRRYKAVFEECSLLKRVRLLISAVCPPIGRLLTKWRQV